MDDIFILFMKMQKESRSRLGSKHQHTILEGVLFMYAKPNTNISGISEIDQICYCVGDYGYGDPLYIGPG